MKLTSVELHPVNSSVATVMSFQDPAGDNSYNIKSILGLDADEIVPRFYRGSGDAKLHNLALEKRTVVILIKLNPNWGAGESYSSLRDDLYRLIASSRSGSLHVHCKYLDEVIAHVSGFVTKFETSLFEKEQTVQMTIECDQPFLQPMDPIEVNLGGATPELTIIEDLNSTAPHGLRFVMQINADIPDISISDPDDDTWAFTVIPVGGFLTGDRLYLSSDFNEKNILLERESVVYYLTEVIQPGSIWPMMFPGTNKLSFTHPDDLTWEYIEYFPTYWGV